MPALSVIVPARDASATLPRTLDCLARQEVEDEYEVVVIDDGSRDSTRSLALSAPGPVTVVDQGPLGPAAARNLGVAAASGEIIAFLDADCFPAPGWLAAGAGALEEADLVQGRVIPDPAARMGPFDRSLWIGREVGLYETANLFVRRPWFDEVGGFEDWLRPDVGKAMAEDIWFGWRARRAGARSAYCAEALVHHAVFSRGPLAYVAERRRLRHFPAIARKVPELRGHLFHRRLFLNERSAAFDALVLGGAAAALTRSPVPLAAAIPYLRRRRRLGPAVALVDLAADVLGAAELLRGSVRARSVLL